MNYSKATLLESPVFRHFDELCHIPHVSGNEKALSDHILAWAMERPTGGQKCRLKILNK